MFYYSPVTSTANCDSHVLRKDDSHHVVKKQHCTGNSLYKLFPEQAARLRLKKEQINESCNFLSPINAPKPSGLRNWQKDILFISKICPTVG